EKDRDSEGPGREDIPVSLADRVKNNLVANETMIDEEEHRVAVIFLNMRPRREQIDFHTRSPVVLLVLDQLVEKIFAEDLKYAVAKARRHRRRENFEPGAPQHEVDFGKRQRVMGAVGRD